MFKKFVPCRMRVRTIGIAALLTAIGIAAFAVPRASHAGGGGPPKPPADPAIAYISMGKLKVMNADGSNQTTVYSDPQGSGLWTPTWSPDGGAIAFHVVGNFGALSLWRIDVNVVNGVPQGSNPTLLVPDRVGLNPAWSPAPPGSPWHDQIVFRRYTQSGMYELQVVAATGGTPQTLYTAPPGYVVADPAWSPEGTRIAFFQTASTAGTTRTIEVLDLITGQATTVFGPQDIYINFIDWARTQDTLAFTAAGAIYTLSLAPGSTPVFVTARQSPSWSPDDSRLAFEAAPKVRVFSFATGQSTALASGKWPDWRRF